jgi:hypothetical protein
VQRLRPSPLAVQACLLLLGCLEIAALLCALEKPARAYVDPGSGYIFLQVAGSMMAGAFFSLRHRIKKFFGVTRKTDQEPSPPAMGTRVTGTKP